jgi:hypothetical protein
MKRAYEAYLRSRRMTAPPDKYSMGDIIDDKTITWLSCPIYYIEFGWAQLAWFDGERPKKGRWKYHNATVLFYEPTDLEGFGLPQPEGIE